ncbi:MAG: toll/interleukin-1 receptor domain-containing protein [Janthinobacterium lividum]
MPTPRTSVFISYSHADSQWLRLLNTHLKPLVRDQKLEIWSDQKIRKGERWRDRIHKQMAMARVGIFLVSADFLASDFIHAEELPPLLKAADREGATLLTVIVRPCAGAFQDSPLSQLQAMNGPHAPLSGMSKTQREQVMASVYDELRGLFRVPAKVPTPRQPAAPKAPKRLATTKTPATGAAAKSKAIAKSRAIAKNKVPLATPADTATAKTVPKSVARPNPKSAAPAAPKATTKTAAKAAPQTPAKKARARPAAPRAKK